MLRFLHWLTTIGLAFFVWFLEEERHSLEARVYVFMYQTCQELGYPSQACKDSFEHGAPLYPPQSMKN
jgi:hypothetical protein